LAADYSREVHCLLGLPFDAVDLASAEQRIRAAAASRTRCFLSTPNVNFLTSSLGDGAFRDSVINSDLSVADGMPLVWLARCLRIPIRERVAGSSLFELLHRRAGERLSVYFFGGAEGAAEAAARRLAQSDGGLRCAGFDSPGFGTVEELSSEAAIARINAARPDILVVSLGARKGQAWIERNRARLDVPVVTHLGAVLNFVAGTVRRAPAWMQAAGLEWMWRIREEPALWRRYARDGLALLALLATRALPYAWYLRRHAPDRSELQRARIEPREGWRAWSLRLEGAFTGENIEPLRGCFARAASSGKDIELDLGAVTHVDSALVGLLTLLHGHQRRQGRRLRIAAASRAVRRIVRWCCAEYLFSSEEPPRRAAAPLHDAEVAQENVS
jgi:N-acetylglucosaminyldiphosphoundecaprenol N-acetyl-beta-D-mannosaminyltransferase